jgi:hypothetical protein
VPTILRIRGYRFFFFSNEREEPPHIHIASGDGYAKFWLEPVELAAAWGYDWTEIRRLSRMVRENVFLLRKEWHDFFTRE